MKAFIKKFADFKLFLAIATCQAVVMGMEYLYPGLFFRKERELGDFPTAMELGSIYLQVLLAYGAIFFIPASACVCISFLCFAAKEIRQRASVYWWTVAVLFFLLIFEWETITKAMPITKLPISLVGFRYVIGIIAFFVSSKSFRRKSRCTGHEILS